MNIAGIDVSPITNPPIIASTTPPKLVPIMYGITFFKLIILETIKGISKAIVMLVEVKKTAIKNPINK